MEMLKIVSVHLIVNSIFTLVAETISAIGGALGVGGVLANCNIRLLPCSEQPV
jgi:hypothetical protein